MFAGNFAPVGWEFCDGTLYPISENETLFQLIGTTYGGDGESNFAVPNLSSRVPIHQGNGFILAETGGAEEITLTVQQIPTHTHPLVASASGGSSNSPTNNVLAASQSIDMYRETSPAVALAPNAIGPTGGSQPHTNLQPFLGINYIISFFGIFPSPT
jgi:microcystin-dependent protein